MKYLRIELKVCEGCGALFLRSAGPRAESQGNYCRSCSNWMSECAAPRVPRPRGARSKAVRTAVCVGGAR